jgi:hypothetical protein
MSQEILYPQWRDQLEPTKYPFGSKASLRNAAGDTLLPAIFLDAHLYPIGAQDRLFVSHVTISHETVVLWIADSRLVDLASASFPTVNPPDCLKILDLYGRPAGILVSERARLSIFQSWGVGDHVFNLGQTEFCATCCMPTPEVGVRGLLLADGTILTGNVWVVGDDGVVVRPETVNLPAACGQPARSLQVIRVDIVGDPLFRRRLCQANPTLFATPNPIQKIRVRAANTTFECSPDAYGNLSLQVNDAAASDTVLRIRTTPEGVVFEALGSKTTGTQTDASA